MKLLFLIFFSSNLFSQSKFYLTSNLGYQVPLFGYEYRQSGFYGDKFEQKLIRQSKSKNYILTDLKVSIGGGYFFSEKIQFECNFSYINGLQFQKINSHEEGSEYYDNVYSTWTFSPKIKLEILSKNKMNFYLFAGPTFGLGSMYQYKIQFQDIPEVYEIESKYSGGYFYGGQIGIEYMHEISNWVTFSSQFSLNPLLYNPRKYEMIQFLSNGKDRLGNIPENFKKYDIPENREFNSSSISLNIGLNYKL